MDNVARMEAVGATSDIRQLETGIRTGRMHKERYLRVGVTPDAFGRV